MDSVAKAVKRFLALTPLQLGGVLILAMLVLNPPLNKIVCLILIFAKAILGHPWKGIWKGSKEVFGAVTNAVKEGAAASSPPRAEDAGNKPAANAPEQEEPSVQVYGNTIVLPFHCLKNGTDSKFSSADWWKDVGRQALIEVITEVGKTGSCACVLDQHMELPRDLIDRSRIAEILGKYGIHSEVNTGEMRITWQDHTLRELCGHCGA